MLFVPFYVNGAEWASGTKVFALATANTLLHVHHRDAEQGVDSTPIQFITLGIIPLLIFWVLLDALIERHHLNGLCRTMSGTAAAPLFLRGGQTVLLYPNGMAYLDGGLFLLCNRLDGPSRTNVCTTSTLGTAIALVVLHRWLEEVVEVIRRPQHPIRTVGNTELAGCAARVEV